MRPFATKPPSFATHVAKKGETLPRIARRYGVSVTALATANSLSTRSKVSRGQEILIPQKVATVSKTKKTTTGKVTKAVAAAASAPTRKSYKVKNGDTLYRIAIHHGVTVAEILAINSLGGSSSLRAGDQLTIPARGK